jgi:hypothetical protein
MSKPTELKGNSRRTFVKIKPVRVKPLENSRPIHADEYTFYRDVRPMAIICKFLGIFSLQNITQSDGRLLKHTLFSVDALWGPIFIGAVPIPLIEYGNDEFGRYWRIMQCLRGFIAVALSSYYDAPLPEMISKMETLGVVLRSITKKNKIRKNINRYGRIFLYVGVVGSILFVSLNTFIEHVIKSVPFLRLMVHMYGTLNLIPRQVYVVMYIFFCHNIVLLFRDIHSCWNDHMKRILQRINDVTCSEEEQLENIRLLHVDILRVTALLNRAYGTRMAFYLATIFIEVLLDLYIYFFYNNYSYIQMEYYIFNAVTFYMLTSVTDKLTNAVRTSIILHLF